MGASATRAATQLGSLNRSVYASMTAFYALSRTVTGALGVFEEYSNVVSRIANVADMSTNAILNLSEAMKGLNRDMGGSRTDLMKGVYRAVQSGFTTPKEFMPIATSAMALRTASDVKSIQQKQLMQLVLFATLLVLNRVVRVSLPICCYVVAMLVVMNLTK